MDEQELRPFGRADQAARAFAAVFAAGDFAGERDPGGEEGEKERRGEQGRSRPGEAATARDAAGRAGAPAARGRGGRAPQTGRTEIRSSRESIVAALTVLPAPSSSPKALLVASVSPAM